MVNFSDIEIVDGFGETSNGLNGVSMVINGSQPLAKRSTGSNGWKAANEMAMDFGETAIRLNEMAMDFRGHNWRRTIQLITVFFSSYQTQVQSLPCFVSQSVTYEDKVF